MIFQIEGGCFRYNKNKPVLNDINFCVKDNQILSILGSNGVGKTTLLKCMLGLLKWTSGRTLVDGIDAVNMKHNEFWKRIGYVPQAKLSAFAYTVEEMTLLGRGACLNTLAMPTVEDIKIACDCLESIGILHLRHKLCSKISGGELQMALIARALASQPSLLVLDEPESNLDFRNQLIVMNTIKDLSKNSGISAIINTHYPEHAASISDKTLLLKGDGTGICGSCEQTITEHHLKNAFGVNVKIKDVPIDGGNYTCVMPISLM